MSMLQKSLLLTVLASLGNPGWAEETRVNDFPTTDRVEFVLECMNRNGGEQQYIYKCSCEIDEIAKAYKYDDYVEAATVARYRNFGGERIGVFRDPDGMKKLNKDYSEVRAAARKTCGLQR
ncbi:MAG: hypothetical protein WCF44_02765 [Candidatus Methylophosphatis roskildensis]